MEVQRALQENSTARCPVLGAQYDRKDVSCYMPSQLSANAFYCCWIGVKVWILWPKGRVHCLEVHILVSMAL